MRRQRECKGGKSLRSLWSLLSGSVYGGSASGSYLCVRASGPTIRLARPSFRIFGATTTDNVIEGNYIGTDRTGIAALGNGYGIQIHGDAYDNTIGPNNVIAYSTGDGVVVEGASTTGNTITHNSFHTNGDLGIELINSGNGSIAPPVISSNTCISATGTAPINATVELFSGWDGEGKTYLTTVSADGSGNWSASGFLADEPYLTATATDTTGNTSEFSAVARCGSLTYVPLVMKNH